MGMLARYTSMGIVGATMAFSALAQEPVPPRTDSGTKVEDRVSFTPVLDKVEEMHGEESLTRGDSIEVLSKAVASYDPREIRDLPKGFTFFQKMMIRADESLADKMWYYDHEGFYLQEEGKGYEARIELWMEYDNLDHEYGKIFLAAAGESIVKDVQWARWIAKKAKELTSVQGTYHQKRGHGESVVNAPLERNAAAVDYSLSLTGSDEGAGFMGKVRRRGTPNSLEFGIDNVVRLNGTDTEGVILGKRQLTDRSSVVCKLEFMVDGDDQYEWTIAYQFKERVRRKLLYPAPKMPPKAAPYVEVDATGEIIAAREREFWQNATNNLSMP